MTLPKAACLWPSRWIGEVRLKAHAHQALAGPQSHWRHLRSRSRKSWIAARSEVFNGFHSVCWCEQPERSQESRQIASPVVANSSVSTR